MLLGYCTDFVAKQVRKPLQQPNNDGFWHCSSSMSSRNASSAWGINVWNLSSRRSQGSLGSKWNRASAAHGRQQTRQQNLPHQAPMFDGTDGKTAGSSAGSTRKNPGMISVSLWGHGSVCNVSPKLKGREMIHIEGLVDHCYSLLPIVAGGNWTATPSGKQRTLPTSHSP